MMTISESRFLFNLIFVKWAVVSVWTVDIELSLNRVEGPSELSSNTQTYLQLRVFKHHACRKCVPSDV